MDRSKPRFTYMKGIFLILLQATFYLSDWSTEVFVVFSQITSINRLN